MIAEKFEPDVLQAFDLLRPYAYKADLARYCLLYIFGGLYVDLSIRPVNALKPPYGVGLATFRDYDFLSPSWTAITIGILWAVPGRQEFRIAIDYILDNCRTRYYGSNPLYPTGPVLLGRAMAAAMTAKRQQQDADDQWVGICRPITGGMAQQNITYIAPDYSLVGILGKSRGGDLTALGAVGTNNYNDFWHNKSVYGEYLHIWGFGDPAIRLTEQAFRTDTGIAAKPQGTGILTYGPYISLDPGRYRLSVRFDKIAPFPRMVIDIAYDAGKGSLLEHHHAQDLEGTASQVEFEFNVVEPLASVEFRTQIYGILHSKIIAIVLEKVGGWH
jgi:hypothetical protein